MVFASALAISIGLFPGIVEKASKNATAGAVQAAEQNPGGVQKASAAATEGAIKGAANEVPKVTAQMYKQAAKDKRELGAVAGEVTKEATTGALDALSSYSDQLGENGDGPLAKTLGATTERISASAVRGIRSELHLSGLVIAFCLGAVATLLCGTLLALVFMLIWRRSAHEAMVTRDIRSTPAIAQR